MPDSCYKRMNMISHLENCCQILITLQHSFDIVLFCRSLLFCVAGSAQNATLPEGTQSIQQRFLRGEKLWLHKGTNIAVSKSTCEFSVSFPVIRCVPACMSKRNFPRYGARCRQVQSKHPCSSNMFCQPKIVSHYKTSYQIFIIKHLK